MLTPVMSLANIMMSANAALRFIVLSDAITDAAKTGTTTTAAAAHVKYTSSQLLFRPDSKILFTLIKLYNETSHVDSLRL
jgi:hypothetical protein